MITINYLGDMAFETSLGGHEVTIDAPQDLGGHDRGPTPSELFATSLGSCVAALTARYCERNNVDAHDLSVNVAYNKAKEPARLTDLEVCVRLPHADCEQCEEALLGVAEHCPVHETMVTQDDVRFEVVDHHTSVTSRRVGVHGV
jgi:uncharacterized OsmC-like protein